MSMMVERATVTVTSPFTVLLDTSATATAAKKLTTYTSPAVNDRVAVTQFPDGTLLVLGVFA